MRYSAFSISAPRVEYTIDVLMEKCKNKSSDSACSNAQSVEVGPHKPGACFRWDDSSDEAQCDLQVTLEGDFAAFENSPVLSNHMLLIPNECKDESCQETLRVGDIIAKRYADFILDIFPVAESAFSMACGQQKTFHFWWNRMQQNRGFLWRLLFSRSTM